MASRVVALLMTATVLASGCTSDDDSTDTEATGASESAASNGTNPTTDTDTASASDTDTDTDTGSDCSAGACACGVYCVPSGEDATSTGSGGSTGSSDACEPCFEVEGCFEGIGDAFPGCGIVGEINIEDGVRNEDGECCYAYEAIEFDGPTSG